MESASQSPFAGLPTAPAGPIASLRRFIRPRAPMERCDLCAAPLGPDHQHLIEPANRQLSCACEACAILFSDASASKYRRVPRRIEAWPDFRISDEHWNALGIPIGLAFFFHSSPEDQIITIYPSPAGGTESIMQGESWEMLCEDNPVLRTLELDVEALLVNRIHGARAYYRAPIDECYKLVGLIRAHWRGLSGGSEAWDRITQYFKELDGRCVQARSDA